jgi:4-diphosphocytidyl-2-C-methyl-D-erythritol kinase
MNSFTVTCFAPAKLNLFLHITARRADGYHCLQTLFQLLDYGDQLHFTLRHDKVITSHSTLDELKQLPFEHELCYRAAQLLQKNTSTSFGVDIRIDKKIPLGGGLGGGSSNAATTLLVLNELWQLSLSQDQLAELGLQLGADVPVFVRGYSAWGEGIGEKLQPVELPEMWYCVIHPGVSVSTAQIFQDPLLTRNQPPITIADFLTGRCVNVCEPVVRRIYPEVDHAIHWLSQYQPARLTGTGACLFACFEEQSEALAVQNNVPSQWSCFVARATHRSLAHAQLDLLKKQLHHVSGL